MANHKLSSVLALPTFDLFSVPPTQVQVLEDLQTEHAPYTAITNNKNTIQFTTSTVPDEYILFNKSELRIKFKIRIMKTQGEKPTINDWKKIAPKNFPICTMFKGVSVEINNIPITSTSVNYPYIGYTEVLLYTPKEARNTHLRTSMWFKDTSGAMEQVNELRSLEIRPMNNDYSQSCDIELIGKLYIAVTNLNRALLGGLNYRISLYPEDPIFYLMHDPNIIPLVEFLDIKFECHRAKVHPQLVVAHHKALAFGTAKYPIIRKECRNFIVPKDSIEYNENNVIKNDVLPNKGFIFFISNEAHNGNSKLNQFNFKNYYITNIRCILNGKEFPPRGYDCDFEKRLVNKAYRGLFEALGQIDHPMCSITKNEFIDGYTIFGFNFTPDLSDGVTKNGYVSPMKVGDMSVHVKFAKPIPETATMLIVFERNNMIEFSNSLIPIKDFT